MTGIKLSLDGTQDFARFKGYAEKYVPQNMSTHIIVQNSVTESIRTSPELIF